MNANELQIAQNERIKDLSQVLTAYRSIERKSKRVLVAIIVIAAIALYWILTDLLGGLWGYILTIAFLMAGISCAIKLDISFANASKSDGQLAYRACVAMDALIQIKEGTYATSGVHIITVGQGKHLPLYERFTLLYPEFRSKHLKKLSKIETTYEDMK